MSNTFYNSLETKIGRSCVYFLILITQEKVNSNFVSEKYYLTEIIYFNKYNIFSLLKILIKCTIYFIYKCLIMISDNQSNNDCF